MSRSAPGLKRLVTQIREGRRTVTVYRGQLAGQGIIHSLPSFQADDRKVGESLGWSAKTI